MKWPLSITLVRHAESRYNQLKELKKADERYLLFKKAFNKNPASAECLTLAEEMHKKYALNVSDYQTPITQAGAERALIVGQRMKEVVPFPDVVVVSPYLRTRQTFAAMAKGWPELEHGPMVYYDDRVREQEHGLALLYSDWRIFEVFHPDQHKLRNLLGPYYYQYPQGESGAQTRERGRSMTNTIVREWAGRHVMIHTHHLTIISIRAHFERLPPEEFIRIDEKERPENCSLTIYRGNPNRGKDGKLELEHYNLCLWK